MVAWGRRTSALLDLVSELNLDGLITHWFPIEDAAEAYKIVDESPQDVLQVVLTYAGGGEGTSGG